MMYKFPYISHIDDVLPAIADKDEFIVADKGDYKVVNYVVNKEDTFPEVTDVNSAILRECRGIIFDRHGKILSRPYHKFFNVGEREETSINAIAAEMGVSNFKFLEKLDGSMVRPLVIDGKVFWATKMGITDTGENAREFVEWHDRDVPVGSERLTYTQLALDFYRVKLTPIFEWVSPKDRIIIDYGMPKLILTAVRDNFTGRYLSYENLVYTSEIYSVPVVAAYDKPTDNLHETLEDIKGEQDSEGYVVRFDNGSMVKIKNEWYVTIHRSKDIVSNERLVVKAILEDVVDDLKPLLLDADLARVNEIENAVNEALLQHVRAYEYLVSEIGDMDRKTYALGQKDWLAPFVFRHHFGGQKGVLDSIRQHFRNHTSTNKKFDEVRHLLLEG